MAFDKFMQTPINVVMYKQFSCEKCIISSENNYALERRTAARIYKVHGNFFYIIFLQFNNFHWTTTIIPIIIINNMTACLHFNGKITWITKL